MEEISVCSKLNKKIDELFFGKNFSIAKAEELLTKAQELYRVKIAALTAITPPDKKIILSWEYITLKGNIDRLNRIITLEDVSYSNDRVIAMNANIRSKFNLEYSKSTAIIDLAIQMAEKLYYEQAEIFMRHVPKDENIVLPSELILLWENIELLKQKIEQEKLKESPSPSKEDLEREKAFVISMSSTWQERRDAQRADRTERIEAGTFYKNGSPTENRKR